MKKQRVLVLMHEYLVPPETIEGVTDEQMATWKTEYDVLTGLKNLDHDVRLVGVGSDLGVIRDAVSDWKPHIAFNLLEEFHGVAVYDQHVVSYLELMRQHYTGCNPRGLMLARDKVLSKKILTFHRIAVPEFAPFPRGRKAKRPRRLRFPLLVKTVTEEASTGIAQASVVQNDEKLSERVAYLHDSLRADAIAEEYIEGRELYVGVIGNRRLQTFPIWEMFFTKMPESAYNVATARVKWSRKYQVKHGIETGLAKDLPPRVEEHLPQLCKRIYRLLGLSGYARMDFRLTESGQVFLLEANPNPDLEYGEDFAESAEKSGVSYEELLQRLINLGLRYPAEWKVAEGT